MFSIESVYISIVKKIQDIKDEIIALGLSTDMAYHAWDSRGQETELPNTDLIGLVGWSYTENEGLPIIQAGILTSLVLDQNQFREVKIMDVIRNHCVAPGGDYKTVELLTTDVGEEYAMLQITDFEIMPAGRSEIRSTRNIAIEMIRASGD